MSRHSVPQPNGTVLTVGWDPPLDTFFAQVYPPEPEGVCEDPECPVAEVTVGDHALADCQDNSPVIWLGAAPNAIPDLEGLVSELQSVGIDLDRHVAGLLEADRSEGV